MHITIEEKKLYYKNIEQYFQNHPEEKYNKRLYKIKINGDKNFLLRPDYLRHIKKGVLLKTTKHGYVWFYRILKNGF
jgi:hypothetical protein